MAHSCKAKKNNQAWTLTGTTSRREPPPTRRCGTGFGCFGRRLQDREIGLSEVLKRWVVLHYCINDFDGELRNILDRTRLLLVF